MNRGKILRVLAKLSLGVAAGALAVILIVITLSFFEKHDLKFVFWWVIIPLLIIFVVQTGVGLSLLKAAKKEEQEL